MAHYRGVTGLGAWGEMHVAPARRGYAGLAPLEEGLSNVAFVTASTAVANRPGSLEAFFAESLSSIPAVASRLAGAERVGAIR
ncbi:MAG TPA: hypothetical protein VHG52_04670, partial [Thermomicrobiales bacterium]|nr:hypothetical protein [Thermomicrobiales bacterium]